MIKDVLTRKYFCLTSISPNGHITLYNSRSYVKPLKLFPFSVIWGKKGKKWGAKILREVFQKLSHFNVNLEWNLQRADTETKWDLCRMLLEFAPSCMFVCVHGNWCIWAQWNTHKLSCSLLAFLNYLSLCRMFPVWVISVLLPLFQSSVIQIK